jgi:hypothetical protein
VLGQYVDLNEEHEGAKEEKEKEEEEDDAPVVKEKEDEASTNLWNAFESTKSFQYFRDVSIAFEHAA